MSKRSEILCVPAQSQSSSFINISCFVHMNHVQLKPPHTHVRQEGEPLFVFVRPPRAAAQTQVTSLHLERLPSDAESRTIWAGRSGISHQNSDISLQQEQTSRGHVTIWSLKVSEIHHQDNIPAESFKRSHRLRTRTRTWTLIYTTSVMDYISSCFSISQRRNTLTRCGLWVML